MSTIESTFLRISRPPFRMKLQLSESEQERDVNILMVWMEREYNARRQGVNGK